MRITFKPARSFLPPPGVSCLSGANGNRVKGHSGNLGIVVSARRICPLRYADCQGSILALTAAARRTVGINNSSLPERFPSRSTNRRAVNERQRSRSSQRGQTIAVQIHSPESSPRFQRQPDIGRQRFSAIRSSLSPLRRIHFAQQPMPMAGGTDILVRRRGRHRPLASAPAAWIAD